MFASGIDSIADDDEIEPSTTTCRYMRECECECCLMCSDEWRIAAAAIGRRDDAVYSEQQRSQQLRRRVTMVVIYTCV